MHKELSGNQMAISVRLVLMGPVVVFLGVISLADGHVILGSLLMALGMLSFIVSLYRLRENERDAKSDRSRR